MGPVAGSGLGEVVRVFLVMNRRNLLDQLPHWFPDAVAELVVVTARSAVPAGTQQRYARSFRHLEVVDRYEDPDLEIRIERLCREHDVRAVLTSSEFDLPRAARIRQRLGLSGQLPDSALAYTDKFVMKRTVARAGIPVAAMSPVERPAELAGFAARHGLPVVVKRRVGGSAIGQRVLRRDEELATVLDGWADLGPPDESLLAEAWVSGRTYHVDGVMRDGAVVHCWPSRYLHTQWETMSLGRPFISGMLPVDHPLFAELVARTTQVIAALPAPPQACPFHAEFFDDPRLGVVLGEIACRAGGGGVVEAYERSFGVNLYEVGLKGQAGRDPDPDLHPDPPRTLVRHGFAWFSPAWGRLQRLPQRCDLPGVVRYEPRAAVGDVFTGPRSVSQAVAQASFTLVEDDLEAELQVVQRWWDTHALWADPTDGGTR